ncbi:hypothetical protein evm_011750 [Chilo suppressalis]|nr:hypothetical protein evm_011750 [Chilo suppressalis]
MYRWKIHRFYLKRLSRQYSQVALQNEYSETPEYPPIMDNSLQARKSRKRESLFEKIKKLDTVEEKQIALNMPRYYGWQCVMLHEDTIPYNAMPMIKCYTRSHFIPVENLPNAYADTAVAAGEISKEVKTYIEDAIVMETDGLERDFILSNEKPINVVKEDTIARSIVKQVNRIISNHLGEKVPHLLSAQVDYDPRHEAFWFVGGVDIPTSVFKWRKKYSWYKNRLDENVDRPVQYLDLSVDDISLSSDEEDLAPTRQFRKRINPVIHYNDEEFKDRYRISKSVFHQLMGKLTHLELKTNNYCTLKPS